jgi:gamma-glutamyltranspeptidase/glutathione hydrolase
VKSGRAVLFAALFFVGTAHAADRVPGFAVASAHPLATAAGVEVLQNGGNAFDAAVAISAAIAVTEPTGSGIGGGGFWLLHRADGLEVMIDGREMAPGNAEADMYLDGSGKAIAEKSRDGALSAAIPGEPAALEHLARKYGKLPLGESLAPAIKLAREGFAVDSKLARAIKQNQDRLSPAAAAIFAPAGAPLAENAALVQTDLAATIERIAQSGHQGFYLGELGNKLVNGVRAAGGIWTEEDLRHYRLVERVPTVTYFRDYRVVSAPPPSAGGVGLSQMLQMLEMLGWPGATAAESRHLSVETMRRAYHDRAAYLGDPDQLRMPIVKMTSRSYLRGLVDGIDRHRATPSSELEPVQAGTEGQHTTHFSVIDAQGNRVAGTLSINLPFGSGFMVAGTGVLLNDEMDDFSAAPGQSNAYGLIGSIPNAIAPGKRPLSSMSPTFVEGPRGVAILGTPGGSRIITMVLLGVLGFTEGLDAAAIATQPRFHHQYLPDQIEFEPLAWTDAEQKAMLDMGHNLRAVKQTWGNMQVVIWRRDQNRLEAAADPRAVGAAQVVPLEATPLPATPAH